MTNIFCLVYLHYKSLGSIKFKRGHNLKKNEGIDVVQGEGGLKANVLGLYFLVILR